MLLIVMCSAWYTYIAITWNVNKRNEIVIAIECYILNIAWARKCFDCFMELFQEFMSTKLLDINMLVVSLKLSSGKFQ